MRRALDTLYDAAGYLAALFLAGTLAMVLTGIAGRLMNFHVPGTDSYAGYCMAASGFLALAHTFKRGEHIRVMLLLEQFGGRLRRPLDLWSHAVGVFFCGVLAFFSVRLAWQSHAFHDISTGNDATPLWIPQLAMAAGAVVFAIAFIDLLVLDLSGKRLAVPKTEEPAHVE